MPTQAMPPCSFAAPVRLPSRRSTHLLTHPGVYVFSALVVTWVATNLIPDHKRSIGLPLFYSIGNLSGLVSSQLYPSKDGPRYVKGNAVSAGMEVVAIFFVIAAWFVLRRRNQQKEKLIAEGAVTNGKEGDEALDFKYTL
jgi:hypothetical protein